MIRSLRNAALLLRLLPSARREFVDRVCVRIGASVGDVGRRPPSRPPTSIDDLLAGVEHELGHDLAPLLHEAPLREIEAEVADRLARLATPAPFPVAHSADKSLAALCYVICRALKPQSVVETGVAYGVTTAYILKALDVNNRGRLWSIDLPPLSTTGEEAVGMAVPDSLRARWNLRRGLSRRVLPHAIAEAESIGLFVHDSLHSYRNMKWELGTVTPYLGRPSVVIVDDVEHHTAFEEWADSSEPEVLAVVQEREKPDVFGVGVFA